ncbi:indolepyruvate oxidoreductase subunit beta family protein [Albibacillus kandeliae]|uniref:indolepyruvate oxidoreductase subunit beta family protein n=1 Tax=Albibacillus kandeliae TaxID=2174228 RepID=UPI0018E53F71|nr:indolepyruvate oxidoreductase subunit beta family protein [Albibacillus kandeliae]
MTQMEQILPAGQRDLRVDQIIKLAVLAVGGQGGGVLSNWIVAVAERNGYAVQSTSVAGVAQRTGATIYYVEMLPESGAQPVFSLAPAEGDVDILIAAEMMEAGRAIMRGFVTPDQTTLIASTHRNLATVEKVVPGSGISDSATVREVAEKSAKTFIAFDMEALALKAGSVISASLFGALAGSGALPFEIESYRETIRASGRGVEKSLAAFDLACEAALERRRDPEVVPPKARPLTADGPARQVKQLEALGARLAALPLPAQDMAKAGLRKVVDYQDLAYGTEYLDRLDAVAAADTAAGGAEHGFDFTLNAAKYIANAMCYDDILRVADLKTRGTRFERVAAEVSARPETLVQVTEFVHPGAAEFVSLMPRWLGAGIEKSPGLYKLIDRMVNKGRRMRSDRMVPFTMLYFMGGLRHWRRALLRHSREMAHMQVWLDTALARLPKDYAFATETLKARRLIKGYSDTHARGLGKFDRVMQGGALVAARQDAGDWMGRLIAAALADPKGEALDGALATIRSFVTPDTEITARA